MTVRSIQPCYFALLLIALTGCASFKNTPQQDYVYDMGHVCETAKGVTSTRIERVAPDGRYWIRGRGAGYEFEYPNFFACMKEQYQAHPYLDWLKARKREATQPLVTVGSTTEVARAPSGPIMAPIWRVGDEWEYAYKGPSDSGTYVWSVVRVEVLEGVPQYVVKTGAREIFYRVSDLAVSVERVDTVVVMRETPPRLIYSWPLTVGQRWEEIHRQERPVDRQTTERNSVWTVEAEETVTVPAGTFRTFKIVWRNKNTGAMNTEVWYAPDVKQWVKIREVLSNGTREREMVSFKLK
jgi:hypothetical protein